MLWIIGGWDNRSDSLQSSAQRLQRSLRSAPPEPEKYGPWGIWSPRQPDAATGYDLVPVDVDNLTELESAIKAVTMRVNKGPRTAPGLNIELARRANGDRPETAPTRFEYTARTGFVDARRPFNHIAFDVDDDTDDRTLMRYMSALVEAWQPDHLGAVTQEVKRAQGHKGSQVAVGRLTYVRDGIPLDTNTLGDEVDVAAADGGRYIRVPGTPADPRLDDVLQVRRALGYGTT
ncbi:hypothetical protein [Mycolicibacterium houstonense]|uniref:hypothetical protein n=1 Tax=Mycolicibacterium houstonense TaxID=146021 RepID=UPI003F94FFF6